MDKLGWHSLGASFDCPCGERHTLPIEAVHVGDDAATKLAAFARERTGAKLLVVSDENTLAAAGEAPLQALRDAGKALGAWHWTEGDLEATDERAEEVALAGRDCDGYVAIGAGTLADLAKWAGSEQNKPVLLYPTAASMNGYTSAIAALKVRGLKKTLPCAPAVGVFADPAVVATAPQKMLASGVADFLSKCSSSADWRAAHLLRGEYYCSRPREFTEGLPEELFALAPAIGRSEPEAVQRVLEALLLSGFGMVMAGSSAPASGGEHLLSHYLDMKHALYGTANDFHGTQVGVGTVYALSLWEQILGLDTRAINIDACIAAQPSDAAIREWVMEDWGEKLGEDVWRQWQAKKLDADALRAELERVVALLPRMRAELLADLRPSAIVRRCIEESGGPTTPLDFAADAAVYKQAQGRARFIRNRFTVLDLAAELDLVPQG